MNSDPRPEVHISIQKGLSIPPLQKCSNCCYPAKFHCPFCLPSFFKPTKPSRAKLHLENHLKSAVYFGEYTIHRCALNCRTQPHYHCLYCEAMMLKKKDFSDHLPYCQGGAQGSWRERSIPSYDIESDNDDDDDDVTIITDSHDHHNQQATGSHLITPIAEYDTVGMKRSTEPKSSKCHQTVQTNFEKPQDCDEYYFMSLVKMFKKLSPQKKAEVRMKIERLLFEAEFE